MLFRPRNIHARPDEKSAELVVQLPGEGRLLAFGDALQMSGEGDEFPGLLLDLALELALSFAKLLGEQRPAAQILVQQAGGNADQEHAAERGRKGSPAAFTPLIGFGGRAHGDTFRSETLQRMANRFRSGQISDKCRAKLRKNQVSRRLNLGS